MTWIWPDDENFRRFAALVADAVTYVLNCPEDLGCMCPEGALLAHEVGAAKYCQVVRIAGGMVAWPGGERVALLLRAKIGQIPGGWLGPAQEFAQGFDGDYESRSSIPSPYFDLGCCYRMRFPEQVPG